MKVIDFRVDNKSIVTTVFEQNRLGVLALKTWLSSTERLLLNLTAAQIRFI